MKKATPIILVIIFILSVVLVSFFGLQIAPLEVVDVKSVAILDLDKEQPIIEQNNNGKKNKTVFITIEDPENPPVYSIVVDVLPANATNKRVMLEPQFNSNVTDENRDEFITFSEIADDRHLITFLRPGWYKFNVISRDGTRKADAIEFYVQ